MNIWTISSTQPFLQTLVQGLWDQSGQDAQSLSKMHILLPTRRACRVLQEAFLNFFDGHLHLMPDIRALGDLDEDELSMLSFDQELSEGFLNIPKAISPIRRQMVLAQFLLEKSDFVESMDQAISLAGRLGSFFDEMLTEGVGFENLQDIVPDDYSEHWQKTLSFLTVLTDEWPEFLAQKKLVDPADRRNRILALQNKIWQNKTPDYPIIVAGVTGTIPAAAALLKTVASMPNGHVVLPAVDIGMDADIWAHLEPSHPQHGFKVLCEDLGISLENIKPWPSVVDTHLAQEKESLLREMMRPAEVSKSWFSYRNDKLAEVIDQWHYSEAEHEDEEADLVSFIARDALETKGKTVAVVTADRALARRISSKIKRWGIDVDDTAGVPLIYSGIGIWLLSIADLFESDFDVVKFLSMLRHPLCCFRGKKEVSYLDRTYFRGQEFDQESPINWVQFLKEREKDSQWLEFLLHSADDLIKLYQQDKVSFKALVEAHLEFAQAIGFSDDNDNSLIWQKDDGEAAAYFFHDLFESLSFLEAHGADFQINPQSYHSILKHMMQACVVRLKYGAHPRIQILGLMEARLTQADCFILCGLNEGIWPPEPKADPFLSRHMRIKAGLPSPDKMIGMSAHDFVEKLCAKEVFLTRSKKYQSAPSLPSRWLVRLEAILKKQELSLPVDTYYLSLVRSYSKHDPVVKIERPAPKPPFEKRPKDLSVSSIKKWMTDPYQLYAEKILRLRKLDPLKKKASYAEKGTYIHKCLEEFLSLYPRQLDDQALDHLKDIGARYLDEFCKDEAQKKFWKNRFDAIAHFFIDYEMKHRQRYLPILTETKGELRLTHKIAHLPEKGEFIVRATADRIDQDQQTKEMVLIDYKSGGIPSKAAMINGAAPQLPLEALIVQGGGYGRAAQNSVQSLQHWALKGDNSEIDIFPSGRSKNLDMEMFLSDTCDNLIRLIELFTDEEVPYYALPNENLKIDYNDYEHLERVWEWQND